MPVYVDYDPDLAAIGYIEPEFVEEFDYWATKQVVLDHKLEATWIHEASSSLPVAVAWSYEELPAPMPVYKRVLKWRKVYPENHYDPSRPPVVADPDLMSGRRRGTASTGPK